MIDHKVYCKCGGIIAVVMNEVQPIHYELLVDVCDGAVGSMYPGDELMAGRSVRGRQEYYCCLSCHERMSYEQLVAAFEAGTLSMKPVYV